MANARRDGLHKLTSRLASTYGTVVVEDLHVAGMVGNRRLARRIAGIDLIASAVTPAASTLALAGSTERSQF